MTVFPDGGGSGVGWGAIAHGSENSAGRGFEMKGKEEIHQSSGVLCTSGLS